jgi:uncharacterized protein YjbJ (UPF0337 family)
MDWNRVEGNWKQVTGKIKEQWGKLTDDDLAQINGNREQLEGKLQERYGRTKDEIRKETGMTARRGSPRARPRLEVRPPRRTSPPSQSVSIENLIPLP